MRRIATTIATPSAMPPNVSSVRSLCAAKWRSERPRNSASTATSTELLLGVAEPADVRLGVEERPVDQELAPRRALARRPLGEIALPLGEPLHAGEIDLLLLRDQIEHRLDVRT